MHDRLDKLRSALAEVQLKIELFAVTGGGTQKTSHLRPYAQASWWDFTIFMDFSYEHNGGCVPDMDRMTVISFAAGIFLVTDTICQTELLMYVASNVLIF